MERQDSHRTDNGKQELCAHLRFHGDNMEHPFSNKMPGFMGETVLQPTCLFSKQLQETWCQGTDEHVLLPRSCQLPLHSRECGICIEDTQKTSSFQKGCKPSLLHLLHRSLKEKKSCSTPLSTLPQDASQCPSLMLVPLTERMKTMVHRCWEKGYQNPTASLEKGRKWRSLSFKVMGRREQISSCWKYKFYREIIHKNRTYSF